MNDLKPFRHGEEGTHFVCLKHNNDSFCCGCHKKDTDCSNAKEYEQVAYSGTGIEEHEAWQRKIAEARREERRLAMQEAVEIVGDACIDGDDWRGMLDSILSKLQGLIIKE